MKVLHVIGPMRTGGAQTQLLGLIKAAHGVHWQATVASTAPGAVSAAFRALGVPMLELRRWGSPGVLRIARLRQFVGRHEFDVIHSHLWQANAYASLAVAGRRPRPAVVAVEHNLERGRHPVKRAIDRVLDRWTDEHVAVTEAMAEFVGRMHHVDSATLPRVPYGIDKTVFHPGDPPMNHTPRIGSIGRLDPEKGYDVLVDAVRLLAQRGRRVEVEIAGTGPLRADLEAAARDLPIRLVGSLEPGKPVADFLRHLDVFVLPSRHREARPVVVLEAMCCGVPVVATDIPGMMETMAGGGVLARPGDAASLAGTISTALAKADARARALAAADTVLSFDEVADRYRELFERAVRRRVR